MLTTFLNEPFSNFSDTAQRKAYAEALARVRTVLHRTWPLVIGGERIETGKTFDSWNPSRRSESLGKFAAARVEDAGRAVETAARAFEEWSRVPAQERAALLLRTAGILRRRKHEFSACMTLEAGKTWPEADADTAEAIDFCEFYAREALRLAAGGTVTPLPGEFNHLAYVPLGVGAVIPPWNFPLAILAGMTTAAVVTGNTVVLKPASDTPGIANLFFAALEEAGLPPGVVNLVTGSGGVMGDALVDHPRVRFVSFTGSREVGIRIHERAAKVHPGQLWLKRVVAEMGGKDAIAVDESADLQEAAAAAVASAWGFQGQKCSACSRLIVHEKVHREVLDRVVSRTRELRLGNPEDPEVQVGPVASRSQFEKISEYLEVARGEGSVVCGGDFGPEEGWYIRPTIVDGVKAGARIACEEIFGPVMAVIPVRDFDETLRVFNGTEYGLTGSLYSRNIAQIARARADFHVGNLYINRKCTGAMVGGHPFGGFNMSGTDSKAGGSDYLLLFTQAKSISEKL